MRRVSRHRLTGTLDLGSESGFTFAELLVTMILAIAVLSAGTWGLAHAFNESASVSGRATSASQAEVGFESLIRDLREAVTCPGTTQDASTSPATTVSGILRGGSGTTLQTLRFCAPAPGLPEQSTTQLPQTALFNWTCNTGTSSAAGVASDSCLRRWATLTQSGNTWTSGTFQSSTVISGVVGLTLTGIFGTASSAGGPGTAALANGAYVLYSGGDCVGSDACSVSWIGLAAQIANLRVDNGNTVANTSSVQFKTGTALRNFGTS